VARRYAELEALTQGHRLSAQEMRNAISGYGRKLVSPPDEAFELMDVVQVQGAHPPQWSVRMPLWTREEGRSDLSIEVTVVGGAEPFRMELDDIHVC
jgi:hypothetical protein